MPVTPTLWGKVVDREVCLEFLCFLATSVAGQTVSSRFSEKCNAEEKEEKMVNLNNHPSIIR